MLIIPVILGFLVVGGIALIFLGVTGYSFNRILYDDEYFKHAVEQTSDFSDEWLLNNDLESLKAELTKFNAQYKDFGLSLSIYQDQEEIYSATASKNKPFIDSNYLRYSGDNYENYRSSLISLGIFMFLLFIVIILLTNRFLTQFVFNKITESLDKLVYGVHQVRDGQLNYRIEYSGEDEFSGICSDFNEMAQRLLEFVNGKQKDEANRKELIAGISHDLRTPLTSIKAYVEGIEKGIASTPVIQKHYLNIIKEKTNDLEYIVNQLFLFSKIDIGEFPFNLERVEISAELKGFIGSISGEYQKKGLVIDFNNQSEQEYVKIDRIQLQNAIINILENSVKYKNKEPATIDITIWDDEEDVFVSFSDNGPGVPCEALEHLFDIFYRVDPSRSNLSKGSGLGLAITAKILERLGGSIRAENVINGGLSIVLRFPLDAGGDSIEENSNY